MLSSFLDVSLYMFIDKEYYFISFTHQQMAAFIRLYPFTLAFFFISNCFRWTSFSREKVLFSYLAVIIIGQVFWHSNRRSDPMCTRVYMNTKSMSKGCIDIYIYICICTIQRDIFNISLRLHPQSWIWIGALLFSFSLYDKRSSTMRWHWTDK